jgi:hypothetical protein
VNATLPIGGRRPANWRCQSRNARYRGLILVVEQTRRVSGKGSLPQPLLDDFTLIVVGVRQDPTPVRAAHGLGRVAAPRASRYFSGRTIDRRLHPAGSRPTLRGPGRRRPCRADRTRHPRGRVRMARRLDRRTAPGAGGRAHGRCTTLAGCRSCWGPQHAGPLARRALPPPLFPADISRDPHSDAPKSVPSRCCGRPGSQVRSNEGGPDETSGCGD